MTEEVRKSVENGVGTLAFSHPKANSLTAVALRELVSGLLEFSDLDDVRVICLRSGGESSFCAGASFQEFQQIQSVEQGKIFFMGFANLILAIRKCPKLVVVRVQGKAVGGGVGLIAAADYALAHSSSAVRLSEFELGFGPFVIGPAVTRKIGVSAFSTLSVGGDWQSSEWALARGLYSEVYSTHQQLDEAVQRLLQKTAKAVPAASAELKRMLWAGTENWEELLPQRAAISGRLVSNKAYKNQ